jgi:2-oxoglutarate dehydrogenase complex dehydrogenase (E1) component-like enzyme
MPAITKQQANSTMDEMGPGTLFERLMPEATPEIVDNASAVTRLIFCSGQVYYDLVAEREKVSTPQSFMTCISLLWH